jgi:hypothetical protein
MQIEHCLKATNGICRALVHSKPSPAKTKKGVVRRMIFQTGMIPRGRGRAPETSRPAEATSEAALVELLAQARVAVQDAAATDDHCWWQHNALGIMQRDEALRFIEIHNRHHLKIISDILSNA